MINEPTIPVPELRWISLCRCWASQFAAWCVSLLLVTVLFAGCDSPSGTIFEPLVEPLVWPSPPAEARLHYVGSLNTSADLRPARSFLESVGESLFGRKPSYDMVLPFALCTDGGSRLFVTDTGSALIHVFDLARRRYTQWGLDPENGRELIQPVGIVYDTTRRRLYVSDSGLGVILVFDDHGQILGEISSPNLQRPCGLAIDPTHQTLAVADSGNHHIVGYSLDGTEMWTLGTRGEALGEFNFPTNVAFDRDGRLYVSDTLNFRVQQFGRDRRPIRQFGSKGDLPGFFSQPKGIALDTENHLYVVDAHFEAIQVFDADRGELLLAIGSEGTAPAEFWIPSGIHIDANNRIWVADGYNHRVQVFDYYVEAKSEEDESSMGQSDDENHEEESP